MTGEPSPEKYRYLIPDEPPPVQELILAALTLLLSNAARQSHDEEFRTAAAVLTMRCADRCELLVKEREVWCTCSPPAHDGDCPIHRVKS